MGLQSAGRDIVYRPDVIYLNPEKLARIGRYVRGVIPDLIVEVVSPHFRRYDLETKKFDYERAGDQEYWVIDPDQREFYFWRLVEDRYLSVTPEGSKLSGMAISGFSLDIKRITAFFEQE